jgi:peptidyl-tRNA hydrolase
VLGRWAANEEPTVAQKIDSCVALMESFILEGIQPAMNRFNHLVFE